MMARSLPAVTSLRFLIALWVFLFHFNARLPLPVNYASAKTVVANGAVGMTFFFVLSGFVLTYANSGRELRFGPYLKARLLRIYPAYLLAVAVSLAVIDYKFATPRQSAFSLAANAISVQGWFPPLFEHGLNGGTWSLSCEWLFYLLFPLLLPPIAWLGRSKVLVLLVAAYAASCLPAVFQHEYSEYFLAAYSFPLARFPEFIVGMCAGQLFVSSSPQSASKHYALITLVLLVLLTAMAFPYPYGMIDMSRNIVAVPMLALLIYFAGWASGRNPLCSRPLVWLGEVSYGFYLFQFVPLYYLERFAPVAVGHECVALIVTFFLSLGLAAASYHCLEMPIRRLDWSAFSSWLPIGGNDSSSTMATLRESEKQP
jgi:peptidoglycan/LPS O-acetylase OafA/YrhL